MSSGALVVMCPMCLKQAGYTESDLIPGIKIGSPKLTGDTLFKDGTQDNELVIEHFLNF
uniref:Uncharacterized protein n=1 Tax=Polynucleobacter necessarius subsp. necessarius (strain STIR1) TaxID=452638 RepID=B1XVF4_POLNS